MSQFTGQIRKGDAILQRTAGSRRPLSTMLVVQKDANSHKWEQNMGDPIGECKAVPVLDASKFGDREGLFHSSLPDSIRHSQREG